jgi:hypothetical protein
MMPAVHHLPQMLVWTQDAQILTAQARAKELLVDNGWIFGGFFLVVATLVAVLYTTRTGVIARLQRRRLSASQCFLCC